MNEYITKKLLRLQLGLYSQSEAARLLDINASDVYDAIRKGQISKPSHKMLNGGERRYYDQTDLDAIKAYFRDERQRGRKELLTQREMAEAIGIPYSRFQHYSQSRQIPRPSHIWQLRRYYSPDDIEVVRQAFLDIKARKQTNPHVAVRRAGFYSARAAAKALGMVYVSFQNWRY